MPETGFNHYEHTLARMMPKLDIAAACAVPFPGAWVGETPTMVRDGDVAHLFDKDYKTVADGVALPVGQKLPARILYRGRLFDYYAHTQIVGTPRETRHPYRESCDVYVAPELVAP